MNHVMGNPSAPLARIGMSIALEAVDTQMACHTFYIHGPVHVPGSRQFEKEDIGS